MKLTKLKTLLHPLLNFNNIFKTQVLIVLRVNGSLPYGFNEKKNFIKCLACCISLERFFYGVTFDTMNQPMKNEKFRKTLFFQISQIAQIAQIPQIVQIAQVSNFSILFDSNWPLL